MSKAFYTAATLRSGLTWDQLPDSVREQALEVLTSLYLEIADAPRTVEPPTQESSTAEGTRPQSQRSSQQGVRIRCRTPSSSRITWSFSAYVYLRQSSPGQVRKNREGWLRQDAMVEHVAGLGWPRVADHPARSGHRSDRQLATRSQRPAQAAGSDRHRQRRAWSRPASCRGWFATTKTGAHLVRLCRFKDVLLADGHRVYDPHDPQDRMVLGIHGAFNEFELSVILERMQESLRQKAGRGEQYDALPPGYICRHSPLCEKHPDPRVQRAVEKVLQDFDRFTSARQLYLHLLDEQFKLPVVIHGRDWREVEWTTPSYGQILDLVRNPTYAGLYVRGRTKTIVSLDGDGHKQTKRRHVPREAWDVFLEDHHEAYITRQAWERNVEKIDANANVRGPLTKGAVGRGCSLMAGLLRCRRCGHRLRAQYSSNGVRYVCSGGDRQRMRGAARCLAFSGARLESLLVEEILEVVGPAGIEAAERATERLAMRHQGQRQLLVDRLQAAVEAEQRAAREYKQTDATYVAVRQALGAEWETALGRVAAEQSRLNEVRSSDNRSCRHRLNANNWRGWAKTCGGYGTIPAPAAA